MIQIVAVGKKHESWIQAGVERYEKRLKRPWDVRWILLPHSGKANDEARQEESERILTKLPSDSFIVLLDETGAQLSSPALSKMCEDQFVRSQTMTFVIGGAYGVDERIHQRADLVVSLSDMVFPHQLVRLLLIEQLYRSQEIAIGSKYHHR